MIAATASSIEMTQMVSNVEKSARLYTVLGFAASADDGTLLVSSALKLRLTLIAPALEGKLAVKALPSTLLRVALPNPQAVVRELIDAGWVRAIGATTRSYLLHAYMLPFPLSVSSTSKVASPTLTHASNGLSLFPKAPTLRACGSLSAATVSCCSW
jgi:hypothetical protein